MGVKESVTGLDGYLGRISRRLAAIETRLGKSNLTLGQWVLRVTNAGDLTVLNTVTGATGVIAASGGADSVDSMYVLDDTFDEHITDDGTNDPHTQYQLESARGAADGYAPLNSNSSVPRSYLHATAAEHTSIWSVIRERMPSLHAIPGSHTPIDRDDLIALGLDEWPAQTGSYIVADNNGDATITAADTEGIIRNATIPRSGYDLTINSVSSGQIRDIPDDVTVLSVGQPADLRVLNPASEADPDPIQWAAIVELEDDLNPGWSSHHLITRTAASGWLYHEQISAPPIDPGDVGITPHGNARPGPAPLHPATVNGVDMFISPILDIATTGAVTNLSFIGIEAADLVTALVDETSPAFLKWDGDDFTIAATSATAATEVAPITVGVINDNIQRLGMGHMSDMGWIPALERHILIWTNTINSVSTIWASLSERNDPLSWNTPVDLLDSSSVYPEELIYPFLYSGNPDTPKQIDYDGAHIYFLRSNQPRWATADWDAVRLKGVLPIPNEVVPWRVNAVGKITGGLTGIGQKVQVQHADGSTTVRSVVPADVVLVIEDIQDSLDPGLYTVTASGSWIRNLQQPDYNDIIEDTFDSSFSATDGVYWTRTHSDPEYQVVNSGWWDEVLAPTVNPTHGQHRAGQASLLVGNGTIPSADWGVTALTAGEMYGWIIRPATAVTVDEVTVNVNVADPAGTAVVELYETLDGQPTGFPIATSSPIDCSATGFVSAAFPSTTLIGGRTYHAAVTISEDITLEAHPVDTIPSASIDPATGDVTVGWTHTAETSDDLTDQTTTVMDASTNLPPLVWWTAA